MLVEDLAIKYSSIRYFLFYRIIHISALNFFKKESFCLYNAIDASGRTSLSQCKRISKSSVLTAEQVLGYGRLYTKDGTFFVDYIISTYLALHLPM